MYLFHLSRPVLLASLLTLASSVAVPVDPAVNKPGNEAGPATATKPLDIKNAPSQDFTCQVHGTVEASEVLAALRHAHAWVLSGQRGGKYLESSSHLRSPSCHNYEIQALTVDLSRGRAWGKIPCALGRSTGKPQIGLLRRIQAGYTRISDSCRRHSESVDPRKKRQNSRELKD